MWLLRHVLDDYHLSINWRILDKCNNIYGSHIRNHIKKTLIYIHNEVLLFFQRFKNSSIIKNDMVKKIKYE